MLAVAVTPAPVAPRRPASVGLRALCASALLHAGFVAWAAQSLAISLATWSVESGVHSVASIEAAFSEGDLDAQRMRQDAERQVLQIPKSEERTSPEDRLVIGGGATLALTKQPVDAPPPVLLSEPGDTPPPPSTPPLVTPPLLAPATTSASPATQLTAVPRARKATEVQVEPIEPSVASSASNASTASSGASSTTPPKAITNPAPQYPAEALAAGVTGRVVVRVRVANDGSVSFATVHRSSGVTALDDAAVAAVLQWRFETPTAGALREFGVPVSFVIAAR